MDTASTAEALTTKSDDGREVVVVDSRSTAAIAIQAASMTVIMIGSIFGNLLILLSIYKNKSLRSKTSIFVANLAIVDLINGSLAMPFILVCTITNYWQFSTAWCSFLAALMIILCAVSIGTLGSIAYDRYAAIVYPLKYHDVMTKRKIVFFLSWIWVQAVVISICPLLGWSEYIYIDSEYICTADWSVDISYTFALIAFYATGPLSVMVYCYIRIFIVARRHSRQIARLRVSQDHLSSSNNLNQQRSILNVRSREQFKKDAKSAFLLLIVIASFVLCWLPHGFTMLYIALGDDSINDVVYTITTWLAMANSMFNPILYGVLNRQYRDTFNDIICSSCRGKNTMSRGKSPVGYTDGINEVQRRRVTEIVELSDEDNSPNIVRQKTTVKQSAGTISNISRNVSNAWTTGSGEDQTTLVMMQHVSRHVSNAWTTGSGEDNTSNNATRVTRC